jgi:hypothetical protein
LVSLPAQWLFPRGGKKIHFPEDLMKSTLRTFATVFLCALLTCAAALAQIQSSSSGAAQPGASVAAVSASPVPSLVNYSGVLKDSSGRPVTSITGVTFLIYKDSQGGAPVWMETQNVTPDKAGRYTVQLGSSSSAGLPSEVFMTGEARWLGVQTAGEAEQPRVLLVAVPYAMKAGDAATIGGLPPSAFVLATPPGGAAFAYAAGAAMGSNATPPTGTVVPAWHDELHPALDQHLQYRELGAVSVGQWEHGQDRHRQHHSSLYARRNWHRDNPRTA